MNRAPPPRFAKQTPLGGRRSPSVVVLAAGLLVGATLPACAPRPPPPRASAGPLRLRVAVDARPDGDGSAARPFRHLAEALAAAPDGAVISLAAGRYPERVRLLRPVEIEGPRDALLAPAQGAAIEVRAAARLAGFSIIGGEVGVDALAGSDVRVESVRIAGRLRFGLRVRGAAMQVDGLRAEGPVVAMACLEGCRATVRRAWLTGTGAGFLVGDRARLEASDSLLFGFEQCAAANPGATLLLHGTTTRDCTLNAVAAVSARLEVRDHAHHGEARGAAFQLVEADAHLAGGWISNPGATGIAIRKGVTVLDGVTVTGARLDADGTFGDAVFALEPTRLEILGASFERNAGAGLEVIDGEATLRGITARSNGVGVAAERGARVTLEGGEIDGAGRPGLVAIEGSRIEAHAVALRQASIEQDAASGAVVRVSAPGSAPPARPRRAK